MSAALWRAAEGPLREELYARVSALDLSAKPAG
jgi:hypothetical protein